MQAEHLTWRGAVLTRCTHAGCCSYHSCSNRHSQGQVSGGRASVGLCGYVFGFAISAVQEANDVGVLLPTCMRFKQGVMTMKRLLFALDSIAYDGKRSCHQVPQFHAAWEVLFLM